MRFPRLQKIKSLILANKQQLYVEDLERIVEYLRPIENRPGTAERILEISLPFLAKASNLNELQEAYYLALQKLMHVPHTEEIFVDRQISI